jgi:hypothetical protein
VRFGRFGVALLVDGEGSFATMAEVFPALASTEPWRLPVNVVLVRTGDTVLVDTDLGPPPREFMPEADARLPDELARLGVEMGTSILSCTLTCTSTTSAGTALFRMRVTCWARATGPTS